MIYNILIVDDSVLTRAAIKKIIDMIDLQVEQVLEAENGLRALEMLEQNKIDVVLADLNMPEMGGVELIRKMKEKETFSDIPVIIVSTESSMTRINDLLNEGIKDFLHKPFSPEEFREKLAKNLEV